MTKNNLKVVKTDSKKEQELKEKNKSLAAAISQIDQKTNIFIYLIKRTKCVHLY